MATSFDPVTKVHETPLRQHEDLASSRKCITVDHDRCLAADFDEVEFQREHAFRDVCPFLERKFYEKFRTKFESAIYNLNKIWEEIPGEWLRDDSGVDRVSVTRPDIEAALMKPELPADGILPR